MNRFWFFELCIHFNFFCKYREDPFNTPNVGTLLQFKGGSQGE
jgi:hypothetical protein